MKIGQPSTEPRGKVSPDTAAKAVEAMVTKNQMIPVAKAPALPGKMIAVIERVLDIEPDAAYEHLESGLRLDNALTPQAVKEAINACEDNARIAHQLYVYTKTEQELYEVDASRVLNTMREQALSDLEADKLAKIRTKAITEADIGARMDELYNDEYVEIGRRRQRFASTLEHLKRLADLWQQRSRSLQALQ